MLYEFLVNLEEAGFLKTESGKELEKLLSKLRKIQNVVSTEAYIEIENLIYDLVDKTKKEFFQLGELSSRND
ncbi:MAG: hypothetical protein SOY60_09380 [Fusobacterium gastrosuis]|uniref:hypothetical protein n=1 Tax=Fusobacterium gastrosuis TaxID=1755100 RepID=UPI002A87E651|nr:hypothetical protein [Fusobacterium gastrosuis]